MGNEIVCSAQIDLCLLHLMYFHSSVLVTHIPEDIEEPSIGENTWLGRILLLKVTGNGFAAMSNAAMNV